MVTSEREREKAKREESFAFFSLLASFPPTVFLFFFPPACWFLFFTGRAAFQLFLSLACAFVWSVRFLFYIGWLASRKCPSS